MQDLNSTEEFEQPVFLIHMIVNTRYFWAYWPSLKHFKAQLFPQSYQVTIQTPAEIRHNFVLKEPQIQELDYSEAFKRDLYRRVKRAELPEAVQAKIRATLKLQRQTWKEDLFEVGFLAEDLNDLVSLKRRYRQLLYQHHPDHGGQGDAFLSFQERYQQACLYLNSKSD